MNYLRKELVDSFVFSDANTNRELSKEVVINGRPYTKYGTRTATTIVANLYKVWDPSVEQNKYVAIFGSARQHPCDVKINKEEGIEVANTNANANPCMNVVFENKPTVDALANFADAYIASIEPKFIKTRQEMIAEGKSEQLTNKVYNR